MKKWLIVLLFLPIVANSQIITTVLTSVTDPNGLAIDKYGNVFFSENTGNKIRKIDTSGIVTLVAGTGAPGFSGDSGLAVNAKLHQPDGIAFDSLGNLFIADGGNNRIRKIDITTGIITTVVGNGISTFSGDFGLAISASLNHPGCICFDQYDNMYIGDYGNKRVRKVVTSGIITTIAGNGSLGWGGDGGPATNAICNPFNSICTDRIGNLYIAEWSNYVIRKIDTFGIISTIAGDTSSYLYNGDGFPATSATMSPDYVFVDSIGAIYISDIDNNRIRKIDTDGIVHTIVGTGVAGNTGDNGMADLAEIYWPSGLALNKCNNLYFGQVGIARIRKVTFDSTCGIGHEGGSLATKAVYLSNDIDIYPNPAIAALTISAAHPIKSINVITLLGQSVLSKTPDIEKTTVDISALPPGIYFVKVADSNGQQTITKIVKQ